MVSRISQFAIGLLVAIHLFGCKPKPDPNAQLKRELVAFRVAAESSMTYTEFREICRRLETELALSKENITTIKGISCAGGIKYYLDHADFFWRREMETGSRSARGALEGETLMMAGLIIDPPERYKPMDMIRLSMEKASDNARRVLESLQESSGRKP